MIADSLLKQLFFLYIFSLDANLAKFIKSKLLQNTVKKILEVQSMYVPFKIQNEPGLYFPSLGTRQTRLIRSKLNHVLIYNYTKSIKQSITLDRLD